ncbi:MAG: DUF1326 domain-containing protein [Nitrososphaeraceae archaeon]
MLQTSEKSEALIPNWRLKADYVEACNCDYGCPCNFSGFPSNGFCRALVLYHIQNGSYGQDINLDGLDAVYAASWPKAIHEGNGTMQLFITQNANEQPRKALVNILSGKANGDGPFQLFAGTFKYLLEPQFVDITVKINGKNSSFSVPDVMDVQVESFTKPVTGQEQETKVQLPKGFIWKLAEAAKSKIMRITTPSLNFEHSGQNAFYSLVEFKGP